jgi:TRAP-type C4-dicarboxylate transport system permease small subunit
MAAFRRIYDRVLEAIAVVMIVAVTVIVCSGFIAREVGSALVWYDEVASISLAWLTYYGAALAALRGGHIGFAGLVNALPTKWRVAATITASAITIFFFGMLAVTGTLVMQVIAGITLVSLPEVSQSLVASVIPITSVLLVVAELVRLPELIEEARRGPLVDHELQEALEHGRVAAGGEEPRR